MLKLVLGELYGMECIDDVLDCIEYLRLIGMSDDIQAILERSKKAHEEEKTHEVG